ncbi:phasin family protein [Massilia sp. BHUDP2]|uniref:phasin family protein n=1 Tax=Massilia sp. BHUDP2 TaxID=3034505 RepID=UPI003906BC01
MTSISDQFSAVRKAQFDAQFDFFNAIASQTLESASRVAALNMAVSRDAVQRSLGASFALLNSRDPRDVLSLGGQAEEGFRSLFSYGRELLGIAAGVRPYAVRPQGLSAPQPIETVEVVERGVAEVQSASLAAVESVVEAAVEAAPAVEAAHPVAAFAPVSEPVVVAEPAAAPEAVAETLAAEPVPVAEPKAIAKAVGKGAARAAAVPHPAAAPVAELATDEGAEAPKLVPAPAVSKRKK